MKQEAVLTAKTTKTGKKTAETSTPKRIIAIKIAFKTAEINHFLKLSYFMLSLEFG